MNKNKHHSYQSIQISCQPRLMSPRVFPPIYFKGFVFPLTPSLYMTAPDSVSSASDEVSEAADPTDSCLESDSDL